MYYRSLLKALINRKRQYMIQIGMKKGLTCQEVVKCSQELDDLLNIYMDIS
jgi:hypothetical protein